MRFLILILLFPFALSATEIDSLHHLISRTKPPLQNRHLYELHKAIGMAMIKRGAYDSAEVELREALINAQRSNDPVIQGAGYNNLGYLFDKKKEVIETFSNYSKALEIFREIGDSSLYAYSLSNAGIAYKRHGIRTEAMSVLLKGLRYARTDNVTDLETRATIYSTLGNLQREMLEYNDALQSHHQAIQIRSHLSDKGKLASCYNNIGNVYKEMCRQDRFKHEIGCKNDSALYYYKLALLIRFNEGPGEGLGNAYSNLGEVYFDKGNIKAATVLFTKAYTIRSSQRIEDGIALSFIDLARLDIYHKHYKEAELKLNEGLSIAKRLHLPEIEKDIYKMFFDLYVQKGDMAKMLEFNTYYHQAKDSLNSKEKEKAIVASQIEHEVLIKDQQNEVLLLQQKQAVIRDQFRNRVQWFLISGICLLFVLLIVSYYAFLLKKRSSLQHQTHMRELHHRVKNNLQMLSGVLSIQGDRISDPQAKEAVKSGENRVRAMSLIHRKLYNEESVTTLNMKEYITDLVEYLSDVYGINTSNISMKIDTLFLDVDKAIPMGIIINELVSNAFKYAFADNTNPKVALFTDKGKQVLVIEDNGRGNNVVSYDTGSFGLKLVDTLCKQLKASVTLNKDHGFRYELIIP